MSSEETSYDFNPITHNTPISVNNKVVSNPGTPSNISHTKIDHLNHQAQENAIYDTISSETDVQPMYGGNMHIYNIFYKKKLYIIHANSIEKSIQLFLKNKKIIYDEIIEILEYKNKKQEQKKTIKNVYLLKNINNKKIKVLKIH